MTAPRAILFRAAGPEGHELVANVSGSRARLAAALGVAEADAVAELQRRLDNPKPVFSVDAVFDRPFSLLSLFTASRPHPQTSPPDLSRDL